MKMIVNYPPNYHKIIKVIPAVRQNNHIVFTYGDTLYNPSGSEIPRDLLAHELVHVEQQGDDPEGWWDRFLAEPDFRFHQELVAYRKQYKYAQKHYTRKVKMLVLDHIANSIAGGMYGQRYTYKNAKELIRNAG